MKRTLLTAAFLVGLSLPAFAGQCPADMAEIDQALAGEPNLSEEEMAQVQELREEGERLHEEGQHAESVETLAEAKAILGID